MLYPAPLRDLLLQLAWAQLYRAKWTEEIHEEWMRNLLANRPDLDRMKLERTRDLMNEAVPDCLVEEYKDLINAVKCHDPDDRHILAAAIKGNCSAIITFNGRDFIEDEMKRYNIEVQHPDEFLFHQIGLNQAAFLTAVRTIRTRLNPVPTADNYLTVLLRQQLPKTVNSLREYSSII